MWGFVLLVHEKWTNLGCERSRNYLGLSNENAHRGVQKDHGVRAIHVTKSTAICDIIMISLME